MWCFSVQITKKPIFKLVTQKDLSFLLLHVWAKRSCICVRALVYWGYVVVFNDSYLCWWWMTLDLKRCVTGKGLPPVKLWHASVSFTVVRVKKSPDQLTVISFLIISRPRHLSFANAYRFTALLKSISQIFPPPKQHQKQSVNSSAFVFAAQSHVYMSTKQVKQCLLSDASMNSLSFKFSWQQSCCHVCPFHLTNVQFKFLWLE